MGIGSSKSRRDVQTKWLPPNHGWIKVNTGGASSKTGNWSMMGGVMRDSLGNQIIGFKNFIGRGSTINTKLW